MYTMLRFGQGVAYLGKTKDFVLSSVGNDVEVESGIKEKDIDTQHNLRPGNKVRVIKAGEGISRDTIGKKGIVVMLVFGKVEFVSGKQMDVSVLLKNGERIEFAACELEKI